MFSSAFFVPTLQPRELIHHTLNHNLSRMQTSVIVLARPENLNLPTH